MNPQDIIFQLSSLATRFPQGLNLSTQDLLFTGWLYFRETLTNGTQLTDRELRRQLGKAAGELGMDEEVSQPGTAIDRLIRFRLIRTAVTDTGTQEYCLTRLGRSLARDLLEEVDYGSEDLCTLINQAYASLRLELEGDDPESLEKWLRHFFHGAIREQIEYKLRSIEEGLLDQEKRIKELGSGRDQNGFDKALETIRKGRGYLDELLSAVQDGSSYTPLLDTLTTCHERYRDNPEILRSIEQGLDFLDGLRHRIERMLAYLVGFVRRCVSYQSFVGSLSFRDTLARVQLDLLRAALQTPVHLPIVTQARPCAVSLDWNTTISREPVTADAEALAALAAHVPEPVRATTAPWKEKFLNRARFSWQAEHTGRSLVPWVLELLAPLAQDDQAPVLALWYLVSDMPEWTPSVHLYPEPGLWHSLGTIQIRPITLSPAPDHD